MNCPYCNRKINAVTGLQEVEKFQKHLKTCLKNPKRKILTETFKSEYGNFSWTETYNATPTSFNEALELREASGQ